MMMGMISQGRIRFLFIYLFISRGHGFSTQPPVTQISGTTSNTCRANDQSRLSTVKMSLTADFPKSSPASDEMKNQSESSKLSALRQQLERTLRRTSENEPRRKRKGVDKDSLSPVTRVNTLQEYKEVVAEEKNKLTVVRFYATWCKACRAIKPKFYQLAKLHPEVNFVEVPVTEENANLHQGLGIPTLPFGHIYHPDAGLVEEMKIGRASFGTFAKTMSWYADGFCELVDVGDCTNPLLKEKK